MLKQSSAGGAVSVSALTASDMPNNIDAAKIGSGAVSNAEFSYLDGVTSGIQGQIDGKAASSHTHAASDIASGQVALARGGTGSDLSATGGAGQVLKQTSAGGAVSVSALTASDMPNNIDASKIGSGAVSNAEFGYLDGVTSGLQAQIDGKAASSHTHAASDIASGQVALARGGTGSDLSATGGAGQVLKQTSAGGAVSVSALTAGDMPSNIDAAKIGSGAVSNTEFGYLDGVTSSLQGQIDGKAASSHTHTASDIASGQVALARGGTGADLSATGGAGQVLKQSSAGGAVSVSALTASDMPSGIDATRIGGGAVDNAEFGHLNGVTGNLQTQIDGKEPSFTTLPTNKGGLGVNAGSATGIPKFASGAVSIGNLDASDMPSGIDAAKIGGGAVDNTEFGHLNGVTSGVQSQLDSKIPTSVLTQAGDLLYRDGSGPNRLPIGTAGQVLTVNSGATAPQWSNLSVVTDLLCGDGSDGNLTVSSTVSLTKVRRYNNLTLASGGVLSVSNGYPIYVKGTLSFEGGVIRNTPSNGSNATSSTGGGGGSGNSDHILSGNRAGGTGGTGNTGFGAEGSWDGCAGAGGSGGEGGNGSNSSAGEGGSSYIGNAVNYLGPSAFLAWPRFTQTGTPLAAGNSGGGGGGGGGNSSANGGGGGGGGAGGSVIVIYASKVDFSNSGGSYTCISAKGGNGGNGWTPTGGTTAQRGGGGGGGGGAGGVVLVYAGSVLGSCTDAIDVSGGSGGNGGNAGAGSSGSTRGGRGGMGGYSGRVMVYIQSANTWIVSGSGGNTDSPGPSSPTTPTNQTGTAGTAGVTRKVSL